MLDSMAGMAAAMGSGGHSHGQQAAPTDSDSDSDLDGGDDSVVTMVDVRHSDLPLKRNNLVCLMVLAAWVQVWLGVFEPQRATWSGMNEALAAKERKLGRLHKWRLAHHRQQLRRDSSNARHVVRGLSYARQLSRGKVRGKM